VGKIARAQIVTKEATKVSGPTLPMASIRSAASTIDRVSSSSSWVREPCREHTFACEPGGKSFMQFAESMKRDAEHQVEALDIAIDKISTTTAHFDSHPMSARGRGRDAVPHLTEDLRLFEGKRASFTAERYVGRMLKYGGCSPCSIIIALLYLRRIQSVRCASMHLSSTNIQRLLLTAVMVASKVHDDIHFSIECWGTIGGIDRHEIKALEAM
jgi:hypothetical protein